MKQSKKFFIFVIFSIFFPMLTMAEPVYTQDKTSIIVTVDQPRFTIKLKSNPTTGYSWFLRKFDAYFLEPVHHEFQPGDNKLMGAPGFELWTFEVKPAAFAVPQQTEIRFVYVRPWEDQEQGQQVIFKVTTATSTSHSQKLAS